MTGPSLAELARTAVARARIATVTYPDDGDGPTTIAVSVRSDQAGRPILPTPRPCPRHAPVRVTVAATPHFPALELTGVVGEHRTGGDQRMPEYLVSLRSLRFTGRVRVPLREYYASAPDPLWRDAPRVLDHLAVAHVPELLACARAHGLPATEWVLPRWLDRYGLELAALSGTGVARVRLPFPDGPIGSLNDFPVSYRYALICHCAGDAEPDGPCCGP